MANKKVVRKLKPLSMSAPDKTTNYGFRMSDRMRNYMKKHKSDDYDSVQKLAPDVQAALEPRLRKEYAQESTGFTEKYSPITTQASAKSFMMPDARPKHDRMAAFTPLVVDYHQKGEAYQSGKARDAKGAKGAKGTDSKKKSYTKEKAANKENWTAPDGWATTPKGEFREIAPGVKGVVKDMEGSRIGTGWNRRDLNNFMGSHKANGLPPPTTFGGWPGKTAFLHQFVASDKFPDIKSKEDAIKFVNKNVKFFNKTPVTVKKSGHKVLNGYEITQIQQDKDKSFLFFRHFKDKSKEQGGGLPAPKQKKGKRDLKGWKEGVGVKIIGNQKVGYELVTATGKGEDGEKLGNLKTLNEALDRANQTGRKVTYSHKVNEELDKRKSGGQKQKSKETKHQSDFEKKYSNKDVEY
jgi:hypothetical protein